MASSRSIPLPTDHAATDVSCNILPRCPHFFTNVLIKLMSPTSLQLQVDERMIGEFKCPVCLEIMHPPIPSCMRGHSYCHKCEKSMLLCPVCRGRKGIMQNCTLENVHNHLAMPCKNKEEGCTFVSKGSHIVKHERFCNFSRFHCVLFRDLQCTWMGSVSDMLDHCRVVHDEVCNEPLLHKEVVYRVLKLIQTGENVYQ